MQPFLIEISIKNVGYKLSAILVRPHDDITGE